MKIKFESLIIFEDDNFLVVNKPPFMASLEDRNDPMNLQKLAKSFSESLSACHRLDKETSGCLLFAKNKEAYRHASLQFEHRSIKKTYHAFVHGIHEFRNEVIDLPIYTLNKGVTKIDYAVGKPAKTTVNTMELFKNHTLVSCIPKTGRMHQIRIHLSKKDAPLINDDMYGGADLYLSQIKRNYKLKRDTEELPLIKRFALHASALAFDNLKEQVVVMADYPKDLRVLHKQLSLNKR
ncbi:RluA family pseudouridine synthase [Roseivirga misakiensis]|uniref:RNA pseudouridine synthase n=1 Tax=Roseivirga misakiensis TaxID=1563681 RepID=A0A1E5T4G7_9BACT|nr:RluA family pseudouridine synthase [Roseivirga misakiensis]OEK06284.1 RNA pseudouridine synthase [Roseivirga misakiensis]